MLGNKIYGDNRANLLAIITSMGNTGFLGLPLALALLPEKVIGLYVLMDIGGGIYIATIMYYIAARSQFSIRDSLIKVLKFPMLYAIIAGLIINKTNIALPEQFHKYHDYFVDPSTFHWQSQGRTRSDNAKGIAIQRHSNVHLFVRKNKLTAGTASPNGRPIAAIRVYKCPAGTDA